MTTAEYVCCSVFGVLTGILLLLAQPPTQPEAIGIVFMSFAYIGLYEFSSFVMEDMY